MGICKYVQLQQDSKPDVIYELERRLLTKRIERAAMTPKVSGAGGKLVSGAWSTLLRHPATFEQRIRSPYHLLASPAHV